jgi:hypothetical protein
MTSAVRLFWVCTVCSSAVCYFWVLQQASALYPEVMWPLLHDPCSAVVLGMYRVQ